MIPRTKIRRNVESGRAFRGVQDSQASAGTRADVDEMAARSIARTNRVDSALDFRDFTAQRLPVFRRQPIHQRENFGGG